ncbi:hypothetical protein ACTWQF_28425 [Streptomyces sp. 8N114]|uniref:hypothetical protein n=1 Tax=Streptomyces sp. 8N114 TaxID=3457419 RepID=UPI003FD28EB9
MPEPLYDVTVAEIGGQRALIVQPSIPDGASDALKNGLAIRRAANVTGHCPGCGARVQMPNRQQRRAAARTGKIIHLAMEHEHGCGALLDGDEAA